MKLVLDLSRLPPKARAAINVGVKMPTPYVAMSMRNHGTDVKMVRLIMSGLNSCGCHRA